MLANLSRSRVLLLQGPIGPFFSRLSRELRQGGSEVHKINFNGGDALFFWGPNVTSFRGDASEWPGFLCDFMREKRIQVVLLFGDSRPYHRVAVQVARQLGVEVLVFEEGYLRPNFITLEPGGTNYQSSIRPLAPANINGYKGSWDPERPVGNAFWPSAIYAILYAWAHRLGGLFFPGYKHHKDLGLRRQAGHWWRGLFRKLYYAVKERHVLAELARSHSYFLVALQVHDDFQVKNSEFGTVEAFIHRVFESFLRCAPDGPLLVFKHHPMDRPHTDYTVLLAELAEHYGLQDRIRYVHDLPLPELLKHAEGTVVINSTVGLSSLYHGTPVFCASRSVYDCLAFDDSLDQFWVAPGTVDRRRVQRFRSWLRDCCQNNGSFYRRLPGISSPTGVVWVHPVLPQTGLMPTPTPLPGFVVAEEPDGPESAQPIAL